MRVELRESEAKLEPNERWDMVLHRHTLQPPVEGDEAGAVPIVFADGEHNTLTLARRQMTPETVVLPSSELIWVRDPMCIESMARTDSGSAVSAPAGMEMIVSIIAVLNG